MIPLKSFKLAPLILLFLLFSIWVWRTEGERDSGSVHSLSVSRAEEEDSPLIGLAPSFYDPVSFRQAAVFAKNVMPAGNIRAVIVPHDRTALEESAGLLAAASGRNISTAVVIGPNHLNIGGGVFATCQAQWQTPDGVIDTDRPLFTKFVSDFGLRTQPEVFRNEHSIGAIVPLLARYFPQAKLLPIAISSYADERDAERLSGWLDANAKNSLVVYSIDFSHYLDKNEADLKDTKTEALIRAGDIGKIIRLNNDYVDSPASLAAALIYAQAQNLETKIIYHSNSFDFIDPKPVETTSHFGIAFFR